MEHIGFCAAARGMIILAVVATVFQSDKIQGPGQGTPTIGGYVFENRGQ